MCLPGKHTVTSKTSGPSSDTDPERETGSFRSEEHDVVGEQVRVSVDKQERRAVRTHNRLNAMAASGTVK